MSATQHTPGPWKVEPNGSPSQPSVIDANGFSVATVSVTATDAEATKIARLIAAAPELLAVLRDTLPLAERFYADHPFNLHYHDDCGNECAVVRARAAIAKAEGRNNV